MRRFSVGIAALAASLLLAGGCAHVSPGEVDALARRAVATQLREAGSRASLEQWLQAQRAAVAAHEALALERHCAVPRHFDDWRCSDGDDDDTLDRIEVTGSRITRADLITNNQEAGVDEGDIVKKRGDRLYVLNRGTLHTLDIAHGLSRVQALPLTVDDPGASPWFDEILIAGERLLLLGYDPHRNVAEIRVFGLVSAGLEPLAHYDVRVEDYFSGHNYGARIEGENLLLHLSAPVDEDLDRLPAWRPRGENPWRQLIDLGRIHVPLAVDEQTVLHAVLRCPIDALHAGLRCETRAVIGTGRSEFYATPRAAYLALGGWDREALSARGFELGWVDTTQTAVAHLAHTLVYRFPFDRDALQVARVRGWVDMQFAMHEDANGLIVAGSAGGELRLQRIAPGDFSNSPEHGAPRLLATLPLEGFLPPMRVLRDALWIGQADGAEAGWLLRQPLDGAPVSRLRLPHNVSAIEALGDDVLAHGLGASDWHVSLVQDRAPPRLLSTMPVSGYASSESRSHAYNAGRAGGHWLFGVPAVTLDRADDYEVVSDLLLFRAQGGLLQLLRAIDMQHDATCDDHCDDWYGNARLFFVGERLFALSGKRMKELRFEAGTLRETADLLLD